jgi:hypothetical protein
MTTSIEPVSDEVLVRWERWLRDAPSAIVGNDPSLPAAIMLPRLIAALKDARRHAAELEAVIDDVIPEMMS